MIAERCVCKYPFRAEKNGAGMRFLRVELRSSSSCATRDSAPESQSCAATPERIPSASHRPTRACSRRRSGDRDRADFGSCISKTTFPIYWCGAADAQAVGRARANHGMSGQRLIQPGDCCNLTANARESGMRALSQATHPLLGQAIAGNAIPIAGCGAADAPGVGPRSVAAQ